jgi:predicted MPP superfamily phosphohydrolase
MSQFTRSQTLTRRRFIQWAAGLTLTAGASAGYVRLVEPHWLSIEHFDFPIPGLPTSLDGMRLAQLSDIHLSRYFSEENLADAIAEVAKIDPDWLVLTGDYIGRNPKDAFGLVDSLRTLPMPIFAIYGNHDVWAGRQMVADSLHEAGATILLNSSLPIGPELFFAGIDDVWSGRPDLTAAMREIPQNAHTILLAHEPDFFDTVLYEKAPISLQLSGHTHGGQVRFPSATPDPSGYYSYAPVLPQLGRRYPIGLRMVDGRCVYTNRGLGSWPLPYRWNCRPELTIITLRTA